MDINEIQSYLTSNAQVPEVKTYIDSFKVQPTLEVFKGLTNTNADFKSFMDSEKDKHSTKGLETWKTKNLDKIYQERFTKEKPSADPKDTQLAQLKAKFESMKNATAKEKLTNKTLKQFQDLKLPNELVDFIVSDDETTQKNIEMLKTLFATNDEVIKTEFDKGGSYIPLSGKQDLNGKKVMEDEVAKYFKYKQIVFRLDFKEAIKKERGNYIMTNVLQYAQIFQTNLDK